MEKRTKIKSVFAVGVAAVIVLFVVYKNLNSGEYTISMDGVFDTTVSIKVIGNQKSKKYLEECAEKIRYYDSTLSETNIGSDLYKLNLNKESEITDDILEMVIQSGKYYKDTDGRFDITVGTVSQLWNNALKSGKKPENNEIMRYMPSVGYSSLQIDGKHIRITKNNQKITLGAVAKGYIADRLAEYLKSHDIEGTMINLGGNIYVYGTKKGGKPWKIGIRDPQDENGMTGTLTLENKFIITSGDYERFAIIDGKRYHHIIDAKTGYPAQNELHSVTIVSDKGFDGDALSTACFLMGLDEGKKLTVKYGVEAVFVCDDEIYYSETLESCFTDRNDAYKYIPY
ncbi:MAG: FAD:protein FMN transferase [Clostridia bacterium]|nr:FAD:protein FMN transferase [Clostridia bacterium]